MAKRTRRQRMLRATMALLMGGSALQLSSCDPTVRATLLTGLETTTATLAQTFIAAFFVSLAEDDSGGLTTTSVP
jgi:hypothetical protein